ncbi:DNA methyltransferase [Halorutilales archaeon Cl-col2-1]
MIDIEDLSLDPEKYQVMPDLDEEDYEKLKRDIGDNGIQTAIDVDDENNVIDGHQRIRACRELGIDEIEARIHVGLSEEEKKELAWRLNLQRRHLEDGQKRDLAREYLLDIWDGEATEEEIADTLGIHRKTVNRAKHDLQEDGKLGQVTELNTSEKREIVREYIEDNPDASNREVAQEVDCDVSHVTVGKWRKSEDQNKESDSNSDSDESEDSTDKSSNSESDSSSDKEKTDSELSLTLRNADSKEVKKLRSLRNKADKGNQTAQEQLQRIEDDRTSVHTAHKKVEKEEAEKEVEQQRRTDGGETAPSITAKPALEFIEEYENRAVDLLITDPPYCTDVDDIDGFAQGWLPTALEKVKDDGYAYVFIGGYTQEIYAYLSVLEEIDRFESQILVWEYKNTLGQTPANRYTRNYQAVLFLRGNETRELNAPKTSEQWAVQNINAPDPRHEEKHHKWQKPEELLERFIRHSSQEDDLVIDPFAGSGTVLLTAASLGREAYGCDIDNEAIETARKRGCVLDE